MLGYPEFCCLLIGPKEHMCVPLENVDTPDYRTYLGFRKPLLYMDYRLDEVDKRIIYHLTNDARNTSAPTIAEEVNVSAGTIRNRIKQLEEHGVIAGYHAHIDYERVDRRLTDLLVCNAPVPDRESLAMRVLDIPGVVNVRELMTGRGNLQVKSVGTDTADLSRIARELSNLGLEIEDEDLIQRELFHPYQPFGPDDGQESRVLTDVRSLTGDAEIVELSVVESAPIAGKTLEQAGNEDLIDDEALIIAIERDETVLTPRGQTEIRPGDIVSVFARGKSSDETLSAFQSSG